VDFLAEYNKAHSSYWRRLHNGEVYNLYFLPNFRRVIKSRQMILVGHVARMGGMRSAYKILVGKPEGKRRLGRPRRRWEVNIRMNLKWNSVRSVGWIHPAQNRDQ
jgi:hypothetical protein